MLFNVFGYEPTSLELSKTDNLFDKNITKLNQTGKTDPNAVVIINGKNATVDKNGNFYAIIDLKDGINIINVTAKAPFKSKNQTFATVNKVQDNYGVSGSWDWNTTYTK